MWEHRKNMALFDIMPKHNTVSWNTVIAGCDKYGIVGFTCQLFDEIPLLNIVPWNAMIIGFEHHGCLEEAMIFLKIC